MQNKLITKKFTIIELMVALGIFAIMMVIMVDSMGQMERSKRSLEAMTRVHENARIIFSTIENDFNHAVATDDLDAEIPFAVIKGENGNGPFPCMVSQVAEDPKSKSPLAEVSYELGTTSIGGQKMKDLSGADVQYFMRSVTTDAGSNWNFSQTQEGNDVKWATSKDTAYPIAPGVININFDFRGIYVSSSNYEDSANNKKVITSYRLWSAGNSYHFLPRVVDVSLTIYDPITESAENATKTKKTFFKRFFIKQGPRNF